MSQSSQQSKSQNLSQRGQEFIEVLEDRLLLSAAVDASGVLIVNGSSGDDAIVIRSGDELGSVVVRGDADGDDGVFTGVTAVGVDGGAGNDRIRIKGALLTESGSAMPITILGGDGDDRIRTGHLGATVDGGAGNDRIRGGRGDDILGGGDGDDRISGGAGDDIISGGQGNDRLKGQRGEDVLTYTGSPGGVVVDLGRRSAPDDGFGTADFKLKGFEGLVGTPFVDTLVHDPKADVLIDSGGGDDSIGIRSRGKGVDTSVLGTVLDSSTLVRLVAEIEDGSINIDLTDRVNGSGHFLIDEDLIELLIGGRLKRNANHTLIIEAEDDLGNISTIDVPLSRGLDWDVVVDPDAVEIEGSVLSPFSDFMLSIGGGTRVVGQVSDASTVIRLEGEIDDMGSIDLTEQLDLLGNFTLDESEIEHLVGGALSLTAEHTLRLVAEDAAGNETELLLPILRGSESAASSNDSVSDELGEDMGLVAGEPLPDGEHSIVVFATDVAGNISNPSNAETVVVDTLGPSIDVEVKVLPIFDHMFDFDFVSPGTGVFDVSLGNTGAFHSSNFDLGRIFGNTGSSDFTIEFGVLLPDVVLALSPDSDSGFEDTDGITNDNTPTVIIDVNTDLVLDNQADHVIDIAVNGAIVQSVPVNHRIESTLDTLIDGEHTVTATLRRISTGESRAVSDSLLITIDTTAPSRPAVRIAAESDSGRSDSDAVTNDATPTLVLMGDEESFISVFAKRIGLGIEPGSPDSIDELDDFDPDAEETLIPVFELPPGTYEPGDQSFPLTFEDGIYEAQADAIDIAGNISEFSEPYHFVIDTTSPWTPIIDLLDFSDSGFSDSDNVTSDNRPSFLVTAQLDSVVEVFVDDLLFTQTEPTMIVSNTMVVG